MVKIFEQMISEKQIQELEDFFSTANFPNEPITIEDGWVIMSPKTFIEGHLLVIKDKPDKKWAEPYYNRLRKLANFAYKKNKGLPVVIETKEPVGINTESVIIQQPFKEEAAPENKEPESNQPTLF